MVLPIFGPKLYCYASQQTKTKTKTLTKTKTNTETKATEKDRQRQKQPLSFCPQSCIMHLKFLWVPLALITPAGWIKHIEPILSSSNFHHRYPNHHHCKSLSRPLAVWHWAPADHLWSSRGGYSGDSSFTGVQDSGRKENFRASLQPLNQHSAKSLQWYQIIILIIDTSLDYKSPHYCLSSQEAERLTWPWMELTS